MIQVILDTLPESQIQLTPKRLRIVRGALVTGLQLDAVADPAHALPACLAAAGMPQLYDPHPAHPAARVMDYTLRAVSDGSAEVEIVYIQETVPTAGWIFRVGTSLVQETTQIDKDGNPILVSYAPANSSVTFPSIRRLATVQKLEPLSSLTAIGSLTYSPGDLSKQYTGTVNNALWQGGQPRTWLCTGIEGDQSESTPNLFRTTFTFLYRRKTWDAYAVYVDANGQIPPDIKPNDLSTSDTANGLRRAHIYEEQDFTQLPF